MCRAERVRGGGVNMTEAMNTDTTEVGKRERPFIFIPTRIFTFSVHYLQFLRQYFTPEHVVLVNNS